MERAAEKEFLFPEKRYGRSRSNRWLWIAGLLLLVVASAAFAFAITSGRAPSKDSDHLSSLHHTDTARRLVSSEFSATGTTAQNSRHGSYWHGAVASDAEICSKIGVEFLRDKGGSAVDAAIATMICVGVANAHSTGLGGGHFMLIYDTPRNGTKKVMTSSDSWITAPLASHQDMFYGNQAAKESGPLSIGVPGEIHGYHRAWERFGKVAWKDLFTPTITMCRDGFPMGQVLADAVADFRDQILSDPGLREVFAKADGTLYQVGDTIRRPKLAASLQKIADKGADIFYTGSLAEDIVADIQDLGGILTSEDLALHNPIWRTPLHRYLTNGDYHVYGMEPPSSAAFVQFVLDVLNGYNYSPDLIGTHDDYVLFLHRMVEAWKIGWNAWMYLGDPGFANQESKSWLEKLKSPAFAQEAREMIRDDVTQNYGGYSSSNDGQTPDGKSETTHLSVYAPDGSAVALTSTIHGMFGSLRCGIRTGIIFNNVMNYFSVPEEINRPANYITPGKRPQASLSPSMVLDKEGNVIFTFGASGFHRILTAISLVSSKFLFLGGNITQVVDAARGHSETPPDTSLYYDEFMPPDVMDGLRLRGHTNQEPAAKFFPYLAVVQAIDSRTCSQCGAACAQPCVHAVSDFRKLGVPAGY